MYVCICNALKDKAVAAAARGDVKSVSEVFRKCGARPQCGKCLPDVATYIESERDSKSSVLAAAE